MSTIATPRVIVLRAPGTNCDEETAAAWELAGARATWHVGRLLEAPQRSSVFRSSPYRAVSPMATTWARAGSWPRGWVTPWATPCGGSTTAAA